jgi:hypothetical protein
MTTNTLRLIRRVQGTLGSLRLYRHPTLGLAEIVEVHEGETQVLELRRHENEMLPSLLRYADEVQRGVDTGKVKRPKPAKRTQVRKLGPMCKSNQPAGAASKPRRNAGGGS